MVVFVFTIYVTCNRKFVNDLQFSTGTLGHHYTNCTYGKVNKALSIPGCRDFAEIQLDALRWSAPRDTNMFEMLNLKIETPQVRIPGKTGYRVSCHVVLGHTGETQRSHTMGSRVQRLSGRNMDMIRTHAPPQ